MFADRCGSRVRVSWEIEVVSSSKPWRIRIAIAIVSRVIGQSSCILYCIISFLCRAGIGQRTREEGMWGDGEDWMLMR